MIITPDRLYHYCCRHSATMITDAGGRLKPGPDGLVWLTDLAVPNRQALGLTSHTLRCDRVECRFQVRAGWSGVLPWTQAARLLRIPTGVRLGLDGSPGAQPLHWWVSAGPLAVDPVDYPAAAVLP